MSPFESVETEAVTILESDENAEIISEILSDNETADYSEVVAQLQELNDNVATANMIGDKIYITLVYIMVMLLIWGVIRFFEGFIKL